jgi:hypothetical protein
MSYGQISQQRKDTKDEKFLGDDYLNLIHSVSKMPGRLLAD